MKEDNGDDLSDAASDRVMRLLAFWREKQLQWRLI
jgi:hypothetical protein